MPGVNNGEPLQGGTIKEPLCGCLVSNYCQNLQNNNQGQGLFLYYLENIYPDG